jgi:hypothetical protein
MSLRGATGLGRNIRIGFPARMQTLLGTIGTLLQRDVQVLSFTFPNTVPWVLRWKATPGIDSFPASTLTIDLSIGIENKYSKTVSAMPIISVVGY